MTSTSNMATMAEQNQGGTVVSVGSIATTDQDLLLRAERVSTGVVVVMAWPGHPLGAMANVALPGGTAVVQDTTLTVEDALPSMLEKLTDLAKEQSLPALVSQPPELWLAGGAQLFAFGSGQSTLNIGVKNVQAVTQWAASHGVTIKAQSVGGNRGRHIAYRADKQQCWVTILGQQPELLS